LLALKPILSSLIEEKRLADSQLAMLYMKDVCVLRDLDPLDDDTVSQLEDNPPTEDEILAIVS